VLIKNNDVCGGDRVGLALLLCLINAKPPQSLSSVQATHVEALHLFVKVSLKLQRVAHADLVLGVPEAVGRLHAGCFTSTGLVEA
jgi:hypothetical protein